MKKTLLTLLLLSSTTVFANTTTLPDPPKEKPTLKQLKGLIKGTTGEVAKGTAKQAAKETGKKVIKSPRGITTIGIVAKKTVIDHPILTTGVVVAGGVTANHLWNQRISVIVEKSKEDLNHLDKFWNHEKTDNDRKNELISHTVTKYEESFYADRLEYDKILKHLEIDMEDKWDFISERTLQDQEDLEKTKEFAVEYAKLETIANDLDIKNPKACTLQNLQAIASTPHKDFSKMFNYLLSIGDEDDFYSVNSYETLDPEERIRERDHIPSYKAIELFMIKKGVNFSGLGKSKGPSKRFINLNYNITAINIEFDLHRDNRTTYIKNQKLSQNDQHDLKKATLKDFATLLVLASFGDLKNKKTYSTNYIKLLQGFSIVYLRNKQLCLYDI